MITDPFTPYAGADLSALAGSLLGGNSGIQIVGGSVSLSASALSAVNYYDGSLSALGIGAGLLLTSGTAPGTSNTVGWFGQDNTQYAPDGTPLNFNNGDADIDAVVNTVFQTQSYDATTLSFNFTVSDPAATSISFDLVFGSDEYPEWVDQFVDCAVIMVNGVNYAYFNHDPTAPLSVIGPNLAAGYFQDNAGNVLPIEYDGVSHVLKIVAPIKPGEV
ncbi:MAG: choice-of-anchor L domain-containing protein, partial [Sphingomonadales bacterium]|nr:choice-of-anchor L domain-containing protein [Sphingomonadales bacterium]